MTDKINKILLAYSGGLDTSVSIKWLQDKYEAEIITYTADLIFAGQWLDRHQNKTSSRG